MDLFLLLFEDVFSKSLFGCLSLNGDYFLFFVLLSTVNISMAVRIFSVILFKLWFTWIFRSVDWLLVEVLKGKKMIEKQYCWEKATLKLISPIVIGYQGLRELALADFVQGLGLALPDILCSYPLWAAP